MFVMWWNFLTHELADLLLGHEKGLYSFLLLLRHLLSLRFLLRSFFLKLLPQSIHFRLEF